MEQVAILRCRCGEVEGRINGAAPWNVNRVICYCDDCQAFAHHLGRTDVLDAHGGTDVVQMTPTALSFTRGTERIRGLRLTPKGLYRWYAACCNTPVGNTLGVGVPFVGLGVTALDGGARADAVFGPPRGRIMGQFAVGEPPAGSTGWNLGLLLRTLWLILNSWLGGRTWPHPFFDRATRQPRWPIDVLSAAQREALRALCGPRP